MDSNPAAKTCQSCRKFAADKRVLSENGKRRIWKCKTCLQRNNVSGFIKAKTHAA